MTTIPIGGLIGGIIAGFDMKLIIVNMLPVLILSVLIILGLAFIPRVLIKGALLFAKLVFIAATVGLAAAAFQELTGVILIPGMAPIMDAMEIVALIAIILLGTFPILMLLTKSLEKPLNAFGRKLGMNATGAAGLVITLANSIPVYKMMKNMDYRGKVINTAWLVPATAALGDHLGFTAGVYREMIMPVIIGKLIAGLLAIMAGLWVCRDLESEIEQSKIMSLKKDGENNKVTV
jgi:ethanolamine transporter